MATGFKKKLCEYVANYIEEEQTRYGVLTAETVSNAIDAFEGGAHDLGITIEVKVEEKGKYETHVYVSYSVTSLKQDMEEMGITAEDCPKLHSLTDDQLNDLLHHCWRKGYVFWDAWSATEYDELERLAVGFFDA